MTLLMEDNEHQSTLLGLHLATLLLLWWRYLARQSHEELSRSLDLPWIRTWVPLVQPDFQAPGLTAVECFYLVDRAQERKYENAVSKSRTQLQCAPGSKKGELFFRNFSAMGKPLAMALQQTGSSGKRHH